MTTKPVPQKKQPEVDPMQLPPRAPRLRRDKRGRPEIVAPEDFKKGFAIPRAIDTEDHAP